MSRLRDIAPWLPGPEASSPPTPHGLSVGTSAPSPPQPLPPPPTVWPQLRAFSSVWPPALLSSRPPFQTPQPPPTGRVPRPPCRRLPRLPPAPETKPRPVASAHGRPQSSLRLSLTQLCGLASPMSELSHPARPHCHPSSEQFLLPPLCGESLRVLPGLAPTPPPPGSPPPGPLPPHGRDQDPAVALPRSLSEPRKAARHKGGQGRRVVQLVRAQRGARA